MRSLFSGQTSGSVSGAGLCTAEEIEGLLRVDGEAGDVERACAVLGVSPTTYDVWKAKYEGLTPSQIKRRWARARRNRRMMTATAAAAVLGAAYFAFPGSTPQSQASVRPLETPSVPLQWQPAPVPSEPPTGAISVPVPVTPLVPQALPERDGTGKIRAAEPSASTGADNALGTSGTATADGAYAVQVVAVADAGIANALAEKLAAEGHPAYVALTTVGSVQMYRVRVGPVQNRIDAEAFARRLERDGHGSPWITSIR